MIVWLLFCGLIELTLYDISSRMSANITQVMLVRCFLYFFGYAILSVYMKMRRWEKNKKLIMHIGVSLLISSICGCISLSIILKFQNINGWLLVLVLYVISVLALVLWLKKNNISNGEVKFKNRNNGLEKGLSSLCILATIGFVRVANNEQKIIFSIICLVVLVWFFLVLGFAFLRKYRDEFEMCEKL